MKYTEKIHAERLLGFLELEDLCDYCPTIGDVNTICPVCTSFIGGTIGLRCPCLFYGPKEAIKRTWLALEAKGYI